MMAKRQVLSLKENYRLVDGALVDRIQTLLPRLMKEHGIDMWIVPTREYNEDPVFNSLVPCLMKTARRLSCLVFYLGADGKLETMNAGRPYPELGSIYRQMLDVKNETTYQCIKRIIEDKKPEVIGINTSEDCAQCDGMTKTIYDNLTAILSEEDQAKLVSAEKLCTAWLCIRTDQELARYRAVYAIAMDIIDEAYSNKVITPGVTTTTDVEWFLMEAASQLGLPTWFTPTIDVQRRGSEDMLHDEVILPGDLIHCDYGIVYLGLCTDTQRLAYVPYDGEETIPKGILEAMKEGNRFQDIVTENYKAGRKGNDILKASLAQAKSEGIEAMLYTHPIGIYGHCAGANIGMYDNQEHVEGSGEYEVPLNSCYALELNTHSVVSCWDNQKVWIYLEETIDFTQKGVGYMYDRRKEITLVR